MGKHAHAIRVQMAVKKLALKFSLRFLQWINKIQITKVMGTGPVPTFAPPIVQAGPVAAGWVIEAPPVFTPVKF